jgi:ABC-type molybdate transport system ATPase subunit
MASLRWWARLLLAACPRARRPQFFRSIEVAPGINIVSIVTVDAVEELSLSAGKRAYAVIKATSVMVGVDS